MVFPCPRKVLEHLGAGLDVAGLWEEADARAKAEQELRASAAEAQDEASSCAPWRGSAGSPVKVA